MKYYFTLISILSSNNNNAEPISHSNLIIIISKRDSKHRFIVFQLHAYKTIILQYNAMNENEHKKIQNENKII